MFFWLFKEDVESIVIVLRNSKHLVLNSLGKDILLLFPLNNFVFICDYVAYNFGLKDNDEQVFNEAKSQGCLVEKKSR